MKVEFKTIQEVIKSLKEGNIVEDSEGFKYKLIEGFLVGIMNNGYALDPMMTFDGTKSYFIDIPDPLKYEVGRLYKTTDNDKSFLYKIVEGANYPYYFASPSGCFTANKHGESYHSDKKIIGYWDNN